MKKNMYFANFNITFGKNDEPMLNHFMDIIYPAFLKQYFSEPKENTKLFLSNMQIEEYDKTLYLVGYFIKNTLLTRETIWKEGLQVAPDSLTSDPYSRVYINLRNHRMILVKNEKSSPTVSSFNSHITSLLKNHINGINLEIPKELHLPQANVNIVELTMEEEIDSFFDKINKIDSIVFRLFPLNHDLELSGLLNGIRASMTEFDSKSANVQINTPKDIEKAKEYVEEVATKGTATVAVVGLDEDGHKIQLKNTLSKSSRYIEYNSNINIDIDDTVIKSALNENVFNICSNQNNDLYHAFVNEISKLR